MFHTTVVLRHVTDGFRLDKFGVAVLRESDQQAVVPADADQLETLARKPFEPNTSDDLGALVSVHAQDKS